MEKRRGKLMQKFISFCLTAALAAGMVSGSAPLKVNAAEITVSAFTDLKSAIENASGDLTLTVTADIDMTEIISVPSGSSVTLLADGNYTLKRQSGFTGTMFNVSGTLKLGSADGMTGNSLTLDGGAVWTGTVDAVLGRGTTNSGVTASASLVTGCAGSSIYLYSGVTLQNNYCGTRGLGGAVKIGESSLYLYGAVLRNNYSGENAGAVKATDGSRIVMNAGEVYGNEAYTHGGAFQIWDSMTEVSCQISGGTVRNNLCYGVGGGIAVSNYSRLELSGNAVIRDNKTTDWQKRGGGIGFADADTSLQISGNVVIDGNEDNSGANNLFIGNKSNNKIAVESLSGNARIGITMSNSTGAFSNTLDKDYSAGFFSDNNAYTVVSQEGNVLALVKYDGVKIDRQPVAPNYPADKNISVGVSGGSGVSYQWYYYSEKETKPVAAEGVSNGSTYTLPESLEEGKHFYYCIVSDADGNTVKTNEVVVSVAHVHSPGSEWKSNETGHWHECACGNRVEEAAHNFGDWVTDKEATEQEAGQQHRICGTCSYREEQTIPKKEHVHSPGSEWKSNETSHWHECACGNRTDEAAHTEDSGTEVKAPTATEAGEKQFHCSVCGYLTRTESIPATGSGENPGEETGSGNGDTGGDAGGSTVPNASGTATGELHKEVAKGENAPETTISMSGTDLANVILTEEERQQAQNGLNIKIILTVTDAGDSVSEEDKMAAEGALGSYEMGQYLDISLFKVVGETQNRITETAGMIQITLAVPEGLKNTDSTKEREYTVIRVHNGETQVLADKDNDEDTITIETDRFSTYALAYKDSPAETGNEKDSEPKTGDGEPVRLYATLAMIAGFAYLLLYFADSAHGMTEKEKRELVERIIHWAHRGGRVRRLPALAAILLLLVYYHGIGKKAAVRWQKV